MAHSSQILVRLRAQGGSSVKLAALVVQDLLERPLEEVVDAHLLAHTLGDALVALTASDSAAQRVIERIQRANAALSLERRPVGSLVSPALVEGLRDLARLPTTASPDTLFKLLDRPPIRRMLRAQVIETLAVFGRRAASPVADSSLARGLGGISKRALGQIASGPGALSRVASAVSGEVERQVEKRATEFADTAVAGILAGIANQAGDAARLEDQAAIRIAIIDGLLEMGWTDLAGLAPGHPSSQVGTVRSALAQWARQPDFGGSLANAIHAVMREDVRRPIGDVLEDFALRDSVARHATEWVALAIAHLVGGAAFESWLSELLAEA
jgi:hypothetical protein